jgi:hypothetical protein
MHEALLEGVKDLLDLYEKVDASERVQDKPALFRLLGHCTATLLRLAHDALVPSFAPSVRLLCCSTIASGATGLAPLCDSRVCRSVTYSTVLMNALSRGRTDKSVNVEMLVVGAAALGTCRALHLTKVSL